MDKNKANGRAQLRRCIESANYNAKYRGSEALGDIESDLESALDIVRALLDEECRKTAKLDWTIVDTSHD
jgi:hypothetical protein